MGDFFYMRLYTKEYLSDSKVRALSREHRADLVDLWCYCDQEGSIPKDPHAIGRLLGLSLALAKKSLAALEPFFLEENGRLYSPRQRRERLAREMESERKRDGARSTNGKRWGKQSLSDRSAISQQVAEGIASVSPVNSQQSVRNSPSLRSGEVCSEADKPPAEPPALDAILTLPCVGKDGKDWPVTQARLDEWALAFPGVQILVEVRKMRLWLEENPLRRKTYRGMGNFALTWLGRAQNHTPAVSKLVSPQSSPRTPDADEALRRQISGKQWPTLEPSTLGGPR